jgi:hypothetical protein
MSPAFEEGLLLQDEIVTKLLAKLPCGTILERLEFLTAYWLGQPYVGGACGEGAAGRVDQYPLYRFDAFDCLTYVNTALALARARSVDEFKALLLAQNYYDAEPCYEKRFHFMSADWNVQNARQGVITDVTQKIATRLGVQAHKAQTVISRANWFAKRGLQDVRLNVDCLADEKIQRLQAMRQALTLPATETVSTTYLAWPDLFQQKKWCARVRSCWRSGMILQVVRPNWDMVSRIGTHLNISHLGFVIVNDTGIYFRHASSLKHQVVQQDLLAYLHQCSDSATMAGVSIYQPYFVDR